MEPTSSSENARQSRGLARFWPSHGVPAPAQRQSDEDIDAAQANEDTPAPAAEAGPPPAPAEEPEPAPDRVFPALTGDTQMVALGSRRVPEVLMGTTNGRGWNANQGGFPPIDSERGYRNGDTGPRHGGAAIPNGLPPAAGVPLPPARSPFTPAAGGSRPPAEPASPFESGTPFTPDGGPPASGAPSARPAQSFLAGRAEESGDGSIQPVSEAGARGLFGPSPAVEHRDHTGAASPVSARPGEPEQLLPPGSPVAGPAQQDTPFLPEPQDTPFLPMQPDAPFLPGRFGQPLGRAVPGQIHEVGRPAPAVAGHGPGQHNPTSGDAAPQSDESRGPAAVSGRDEDSEEGPVAGQAAGRAGVPNRHEAIGWATGPTSGNAAIPLGAVPMNGTPANGVATPLSGTDPGTGLAGSGDAAPGRAASGSASVAGNGFAGAPVPPSLPNTPTSSTGWIGAPSSGAASPTSASPLTGAAPPPSAATPTSGSTPLFGSPPVLGQSHSSAGVAPSPATEAGHANPAGAGDAASQTGFGDAVSQTGPGGGTSPGGTLGAPLPAGFAGPPSTANAGIPGSAIWAGVPGTPSPNANGTPTPIWSDAPTPDGATHPAPGGARAEASAPNGLSAQAEATGAANRADVPPPTSLHSETTVIRPTAPPPVGPAAPNGAARVSLPTGAASALARPASIPAEAFTPTGAETADRDLPGSDPSRAGRRSLADDEASVRRRRSLEDAEAEGRRRGPEEAEATARRRSLEDDETDARRRSHEDADAAGRRRSLEDADAAGRRRSTSLDDAAEPQTGRRSAHPDDGEAGHDTRPAPAGKRNAPKRPGDVGETHISFWDDEATKHFQAAWYSVKAEFVDDPVTALTRAHDLLTDAVNELTESLLAERDDLDPLRTTSTPDTESMRMAMRGYREFLDRILAL